MKPFKTEIRKNGVGHDFTYKDNNGLIIKTSRWDSSVILQFNCNRYDIRYVSDYELTRPGSQPDSKLQITIIQRGDFRLHGDRMLEKEYKQIKAIFDLTRIMEIGPYLHNEAI
tara:strand:+ start:7476 stop:7814 length:339 start_codon:yes stop_codon:yes gene_type:complete